MASNREDAQAGLCWLWGHNLKCHGRNPICCSLCEFANLRRWHLENYYSPKFRDVLHHVSILCLCCVFVCLFRNGTTLGSLKIFLSLCHLFCWCFFESFCLDRASHRGKHRAVFRYWVHCRTRACPSLSSSGILGPYQVRFLPIGLLIICLQLKRVCVTPSAEIRVFMHFQLIFCTNTAQLSFRANAICLLVSTRTWGMHSIHSYQLLFEWEKFRNLECAEFGTKSQVLEQSGVLWSRKGVAQLDFVRVARVVVIAPSKNWQN